MCTGRDAPGHIAAAVHTRTMTMETRSHGAGFSPSDSFYVYPQWAGNDAYVNDLDGVYQRSFRVDGLSQIMQMWFEPDASGTFYTANWDNNRCQRIGQ